MAGNMANPDMEILFGVSGGGDLNGESGKLILGQLNEIVSNINKNPLKIRFSLETDAQQQRQFQEQIKGLLGSVKTEGVKIDKLTLSESAIADFQRQLSKLGNNIRSGSDMEKISAETDKASKAVERLNISEEKQLRTLREAWRLLGNLENKVKGFSSASGGTSHAAYQTIVKDAEQLRSALQNLDGQDIKFNGLLGNSGISDLRQLSGLLEGIRDRLSKSTTEIMRFGENSAQSYTKWNHILAETESKLAKLQALQAEASRTGSTQLAGQVQGDYDSLKNIQTEFLDGAKSIDELRVKLSEINLAIKTHENSLRESRTAYDDWTAKIKDVSSQIEETGKAIHNLSSSTDHAGEIENLRQKYVALSEALQNSRTSFQEYNSSSQDSKNATDANIQKIREESDALAQSVNRLKEQIDTEKTSAKFARERNTLYTQTIRLLEQIGQAQKNWSAAANGSQSENYKSLGRMAEQLRIIKSELEGTSPNLTSLKGQLSQVGGAFKQVSAEIKEAGQDTATFSSKIKDSISQLARIFSISSIVYASIRYIKQMITTTIELDDAMTQLRIVTRAASSDISAYSDTIATSAKRIGASIADLIDSATTYARLGYSLDESSKLAEFTSMLQNVGDIDVSKAQDAITSIVKAFNIPVDKIESVMDKLVITGNNFPISVSQIAEGMTNASSALSAAGNTFEQSVALLTAANTTIQNASKSSTGLRTIAARLRNTKTELDELGEQMTWAQYNDLVSALTKHSVALTDMNGEFRSTYDILSDIARIWKELSSMEQAGLANKIAGVRQQAIFFSLIEQFQEASGAMEDMANSAGTLQESYDLYMESTTAHINQFKAAFQELSKNTFSTDFLNIFITFGTLLLEIVGKIMNVVNALGGLETAIYAVAIAVSFLKAEQILSGIEGIGKALVSLGVKSVSVAGTIATTFTGAFTAAQAAGSGALASLGSGFTALISSAGITGVAIAGVVAALGGIILAVNKYKDHVKETVETSKALRTEHAKTLDTLDKNRKTVEDLAKTFETLSVGVDKNGRNVSLSAEEYAQYQDIVAQLADINPSLVRGYNQEKQAIIDKNSAIADTIQFLKDQRKLELTMQTSQENNWTIAKGIINELKQSQKEIRSESARVYDAFQEGLKASMRKNGAHVESILGADLEALKKQILSMYNLDSTSLASLSGYSASAWDAIFRQISNSSFNHGQIIRENMDDIVQYLDLSAQINLKNTLSCWDAAVTQAENKSKAFQAQLDANAMSLDSYEQLSDDARAFIHSWIDTIQIGARDFEKSINEMADSVQAAVTRLANDPETQKKIEKLFDFNFSEMNAGSIKNASAEAEKLIKKIQSALNLSNKDMAQIRANIGLDVNFTDENGGEIKTQGDLVEYVENKVRSIFGDDVDIGNLGMDDLRLLFSVDENDLAGFETLEEYLQSIAEQRDSVNETADALSDLSDTISDLKSAYDTLQTAQKEMDSGTGLSPETIKSIIAALKDTGKDYLDFLYEENGIIKLNTDLWKENANSRMSGDISHIKSEISALESRNAVIKETIGNYSKLGSANGVSTFSGKIQDLNAELAENTAKIQANQNMLALYENLYASVTGDVNTYQGALQNFSELSSFIDTITSKFQTLADIQTSLANGFALPLEKAMEFAAVYPEILDNAQYTADGQVLLNEAVANNFVGAKKAELDAAIDAKIADLESDKEVLESKVAFAQAQLDLAESAAKGEGEITEELAKYLIEAGDFVRQELIKAGIDEVHANEMAVAAMAGDFEEFDRIAKEVCANMDSNFGEAAYNAAVTLYRNMEAGKGSLSDLAAQAQNTAKAIAAMANGEVSGSTAIVHNNSNSGVKGPSAKIDTVKGKGNFEGSDYSYTPQKSSLDDFISQTKLDISKYKSQIAAINGQIAALNALKNTKLQKFASTKPSSGSGGSGSGNKGKSGSKPKSSGSSSSSGSDKNKKEKETKEVEEYIPVIDELREALERLRQVQTKRAELENIVDDPDRIHERVAALKEENAEFEYQANCLSQHLNALKLTSAIKNRGLNLDTYIDAYQKYIDSNGEAAESLNALGEGAENAGISVSDFMNILLDYDGFKSQYAVMKDLGQEELQNEIQQTSEALSENTKELLNNETAMRRYQAMLNGIDGSFNNEPIARLRVQIQLTKDLLSVYQSEKDALANLNQQRDRVIASSIESLRELGFVVEYNARTDELWIENLELLQELVADNQGKYETLQEATNALRKETEDLIGTVTDLNDENRENLKSWRELDATVREAKISIVDNLKEIVTKASEAVDSIQNVYDTLKTAADEYAENDGFISIDTYQSIIELGAEYMQYLRDENNLLVINEESINRVIAAKTEQLALENALTYVERLREAARSGSIESLNRLVYATDMATDATWGLVYAQLDVLRVTGDLDEAQYKAALHNIQAIESLSKTTIAGIGKVGDTAAEAAEKAAEKYKKELEALQEELEGMNDGMKDIIDYVMDMLKHRIEEQIDALNDMKAAYKEIISLKKESLKSSKNESDYQKSIADKVKEINKLQARISALSLDDSRSATAERSKLMEELAALQEDLSDKQADHALDAQMDALDAMQESYEKEKDAEIAVLEHSISSTQKLYDMAIDYIDAHWNTLYRELIEWNTEWGNSLNSEITSAWDSCCAAVERYGSYLKAVTALAEELKEVTRSIAYIEAGNYTYEGGKLSLGTKPESSIDGEEEKKNNIIVADRNVTEATNMQKASAILTQMYNNMNQHGGAANKYGTSASDKQRLSQENLQLGAALTQYGIDAFRSTNPDDYGTWYVREATGEVKKLFEAYANLIDWKNVKYMHTGGVVGDGSIKADEKLRVLQDGEWVLSKKMVDNLTAQMERIEVLESAIREMPNNLGNSPLVNLADDGYRDIGNSIANNAVYNVTVTAPVAVYPLQKMSDREIQDLTDRISTNTTGKILDQFAKSGKFAPNQSRFRML